MTENEGNGSTIMQSNNINLKGICKLLRNSKNVIIIAHERPDGDTIGCASALTCALKKFADKNVWMLCPDDVSERLNWMCSDDSGNTLYAIGENKERLINAANTTKNDYLTVTVDVADKKLIGILEDQIERIDLKIDHHPARNCFAKYNYSDTQVGSCCEIIYDIITLLSENEEIIDKKIASSLYAGIISDTGNFKYPSVTEKTHFIAGKLIETGISHSKINEKMFGKRTIQDLNALKLALDTLDIVQIDEYKVGIITVTNAQKQQYGLDDDHLNELKSFGRDIDGVELGVMIRQDSDEAESFRISMRSGEFDVSKVCELFGGGGHVRASGASIKAADISDAKKQIIEAIKAVNRS